MFCENRLMDFSSRTTVKEKYAVLSKISQVLDKFLSSGLSLYLGER